VEKLPFAVGGFKPSHAILLQCKLLKEAKDKGFKNCNHASMSGVEWSGAGTVTTA
jgi:hypothetical protein